MNQKVLQVMEKLATKPLVFEPRKGGYYFNYKTHTLFFQQTRSGEMFFGVEGYLEKFKIDEKYRPLFYQIVYPEKALDEILSLPPKSKFFLTKLIHKIFK